MIQLEVDIRETTGKKVKSLRREGLVPGQVYGIKNINIQVEETKLKPVLKEAGSTNIIALKTQDATFHVLAKDAQFSLDRKHYTHIEFYEVDMNKKVNVTVPIKVIGLSPLVTEGGILVNGASTIEIEVLPDKIPNLIEVDSSVLTDFADVINAKDVNIPEGSTLTSNPDTMIVTASETRATRQKAQEQREQEKQEQANQ